jgi:hypothetical protein
MEVQPDKAYWVFDTATKEVTIVGSISPVARTKQINVGWNFIGSSYPMQAPIASSGLDACTAGWDASSAGALYSNNAGSWDIAWRDTVTQKWLDVYGNDSTLQLRPAVMMLNN